MKERTFAAQDYTYGFNGQEQDTELLGGAVSFKYRVHDPRIGRFLSVDPLTTEYPYYTPYQFAGNEVISSIDVEGAEPKEMIDAKGKLTKPIITLLNAAFYYDVDALKASKWIDYESNTLSYWGQLWVTMTGEPTATVSGSIVYYKVDLASETHSYDLRWFNLIGHEELHRQDVASASYLTFYGRYLIEGVVHEYEEIGTEYRAFKVGDYHSPYRTLSTRLYDFKDANGMTFMQVLKDPNLSESQKNLRMAEFGLKFRLIVLDERIMEIENMISTFKKYVSTDDEFKNLPENELQEIINYYIADANKEIKRLKEEKKTTQVSIILNKAQQQGSK